MNWSFKKIIKQRENHREVIIIILIEGTKNTMINTSETVNCTPSIHGTELDMIHIIFLLVYII